MLYAEYEQLSDAYPGWSLSELKSLTYRERKHWVARYLYKLEQELQRQHRQNNTTQTTIGSIGQGVTFRGTPVR